MAFPLHLKSRVERPAPGCAAHAVAKGIAVAGFIQAKASALSRATPGRTTP